MKSEEFVVKWPIEIFGGLELKRLIELFTVANDHNGTFLSVAHV